MVMFTQLPNYYVNKWQNMRTWPIFSWDLFRNWYHVCQVYPENGL